MPEPLVYEVTHLHQPGGWLSPGYVDVDENGYIAGISTAPPKTKNVVKLSGFALPGLPNLHSHAFQRALAGRTEFVRAARNEDNLWNWRDEMYRFVERLSPEDYEAIAAQAYLEMLKGGMTSVCEFHYVHHRPDGRPYDNQREMSERLISAASRVGISLTLLPVLYCRGGIGKPPSDSQRRFVHSDVDAFLKLVEGLARQRANLPTLQVGLGLHSLRAVTPADLEAAVTGVTAMQADSRVHIHVSETLREVEEVEAGLGARPVRWLADNVELDERWTLVHATHLDDAETRALARSGAVAGLCPMTEAMMGDGFFPLVEYQALDGVWGVGTDSHYTGSAAEELRVLECGKRLQLRRRNVIATPGSGVGAHSGRRLFDLALHGGNRAAAQAGGALIPGRRADMVILDPESPALLAHGRSTALDAWVLSGMENAVRDVMVAGSWIVRDGHHPREQKIKEAYVESMRRLC